MTAAGMTIDNWIGGHARFFPGKAALRFKGTALSYGDLDAQVGRMAAALAGECGLTRGDRVAYYGMNSPETFVLLFAAARLGLMLVPLNWRLAVPELAFIVADCAPKLLVVGEGFEEQAAAIAEGLDGCRIVSAQPRHEGLTTLEALRAAAASPIPAGDARFPASIEDPLLIVYTSGATGMPKGAVLTQAAMQCNAMMSQHAHDMTAHDHILNVLPLFHVGGLAILCLPALSLGATVTLHEKFDPEAALEAIGGEGITLAITVPTVLQAMLDSSGWAATDLSSMRSVSIGSTDVPVNLIEAVHARGVPVQQIYGATETGPIAIYQRMEAAFDTVGSIGRTGLYCRTRLVGDDGRDAAEGAHGEIWVKGLNVLSRYWNNEEMTKASLVDGWFRTGDVARRDADGNHWFADRIKHVIISGGENIYAAELERVLRGHAGLRELSVVGRRHDKWGEVPVVVAVRAGEAVTAADLLAAYDGRLARFKHPKDVVFVEALPRNAMGKVLVDEVRRLAAAPPRRE